MTQQHDDLAALLSDFARCADRLWAEYQVAGPGGVDAALFAPLADLGPRLMALLEAPPAQLPHDLDRAALRAAVERAIDLARRCATLPQGLCFVAGEAGLMPRRDQIEDFATARATIRDAVGRID